VGEPYVTPFLSVWLFDCSSVSTEVFMVSGVTGISFIYLM
jgi:hypothetical protein